MNEAAGDSSDMKLSSFSDEEEVDRRLVCVEIFYVGSPRGISGTWS